MIKARSVVRIGLLWVLRVELFLGEEIFPHRVEAVDEDARLKAYAAVLDVRLFVECVTGLDDLGHTADGELEFA